MATKSERFRYEAERSGPKKPKQAPPPRRAKPVDTSQPGTSASSRRASAPSNLYHFVGYPGVAFTVGR